MKKVKYIAISIILCTMLACKKDFLNVKPNTKIVTPTSLEDLQSLLENSAVNTSVVDPFLPTLSADEYDYADYNAFQGAPFDYYRNAYVWNKEIFNGFYSIDWEYSYKKAFYANVVLDQLENLSPNENKVKWNDIKAQALFSRSWAFYQLLQTFAPAYDIATEQQDLGIPLRLTASIDYILPRSNIKDCYNQVTADLQHSIPLFADSFNPNHINASSKAGCYAFLSRVYLSMRSYDKAEKYADSTLSIYSKLNDYNNRSTTAVVPFRWSDNPEIIYISSQNSGFANNPSYIVNENLLQSYASNDLRHELFFRLNANTSKYQFKYSYGGASNGFSGLAVDELYLIKAECLARRNAVSESMDKLNELLKTRFSGTYVAYTATSSSQALEIILNERKKELVVRGLRWSDLRRLNKEGSNITLSRAVNGTAYTLSPNSPRYVMPIPDNEINVSGIQQNIR